MNKADVSLDTRMSFIGPKAETLSIMTGETSMILDLADVRSEHWADTDDAYRQALLDPFVYDVTLVEGGLVSAYLDAVGPILPPEDVMVTEQFLLAERSVFEVESVTAGDGMSLRDLRTGDRMDVVERMGSRVLRVGDMFCSRVVAVGEENQLFGGIEPVEPGRQRQLMELLDDDSVDPLVLVEYLSRRFAPPRVVTRDGDPVMMCEGIVELSATQGIRRKLSRRFGAADGNHWVWSDGSTALGGLELVGSQLRVDAMSERRFDELLDTVLSLDPSATLIDETRSPSTEFDNPTDTLDIQDPQLLAVLDQQVRQYEQSWVDESIPALDGVTPRQAAEDPTRRDDLLKLLDSFPQGEQPGAMSVRRLREMLGL